MGSAETVIDQARLVMHNAGQPPRIRRMGPFRRDGGLREREYIAPRSGEELMVSGTTYRQHGLLRAGIGPQTFRLEAEPNNPVDPNAVAVYCKHQDVGYITAKTTDRYCDALQRLETTGYSGVCVPSRIAASTVYVAHIDSVWPEDLK